MLFRSHAAHTAPPKQAAIGMSILVDTAVWIDHFRRSNDALVNLVSLDMAVTHPMVIVELACGTPPAPRAQTLGDMALLASAQQATLGEAQEFIEREKLYGLGCGLVDIALLASAIITPNTQLWTMNKRLSDLAQRFGVAYQPSLH